MSATLTHTPLPGTFGAVLDIDLRAPLASAAQEQLRQLFYRYHLLLFRGQQLQPEEHGRVCGYLGPILRDPEESMGYISNVRPDGGLGSAQLAFHSDLAFCPQPFDAISLYAVDVIDDATSTRFASAAHAYTTLDEASRQRLAGLQARHLFTGNLGGRNRCADPGPDVPQAIHPLIMTHPVSGQALVYANEMLTDSIVGMAREESDAILDGLFERVYQPDNIYEHRWRLNDLVIWDNHALQHARGDVSQVGNRTLHRVVNATASLFDTYPQFRDPRYRT